MMNGTAEATTTTRRTSGEAAERDDAARDVPPVPAPFQFGGRNPKDSLFDNPMTTIIGTYTSLHPDPHRYECPVNLNFVLIVGRLGNSRYHGTTYAIKEELDRSTQTIFFRGDWPPLPNLKPDLSI